eukprot:COSAG06_NODE_1600_length_8965_cov_18.029664_5_plen_93_part_00
MVRTNRSSFDAAASSPLSLPRLAPFSFFPLPLGPTRTYGQTRDDALILSIALELVHSSAKMVTSCSFTSSCCRIRICQMPCAVLVTRFVYKA